MLLVVHQRELGQERGKRLNGEGGSGVSSPGCVLDRLRSAPEALSALQLEQKEGSCSLEHLQQCHRAEEQIRSLCEEHSVRGWCALSFSPLP